MTILLLSGTWRRTRRIVKKSTELPNAFMIQTNFIIGVRFPVTPRITTKSTEIKKKGIDPITIYRTFDITSSVYVYPPNHDNPKIVVSDCKKPGTKIRWMIS
jgi:hypothetical protein